MKRKKRISKKMIIFFFTLFSILSIYWSLLIFYKSLLDHAIGYILGSIITIAALTQGYKLGDDFQRSIFFRKELHEEKKGDE